MCQEKRNAVDESVIRAVGLYGGGVARSRNVCGALLGAAAAISSMYSRGNLDEKEDPRLWELGAKLVKKFEELTEAHGGIRCQDIARVDFSDPDAVRQFRADPESRRKYCFQAVGGMARFAGELIDGETSK